MSTVYPADVEVRAAVVVGHVQLEVARHVPRVVFEGAVDRVDVPPALALVVGDEVERNLIRKEIVAVVRRTFDAASAEIAWAVAKRMVP